MLGASLGAGALKGGLSHPRLNLRLTQLRLVARSQGGITLGPEQGDLGADFCYLGNKK